MNGWRHVRPGIGYFTIPVAGCRRTVHAIEINPVACGYLRRNAAENRLADRITAIEGDCREKLDGTFDRILMGHFDAIAMLPHALRHAGAGTVIHLHSIGPCEKEIEDAVRGTGFSCGIEVHKVKKYRPRAWHVVHDITIA
jgi:tRNA wybutosine-synthesizing protein 2